MTTLRPYQQAAMDAVFNSMSAAEMVETIVMCYLRDGRTEGRCGSLVKLDGINNYRITTAPVLSEANGRTAPLALTFIISGAVHGWSVAFKASVGRDRELCVATAAALCDGAAYSASRH